MNPYDPIANHFWANIHVSVHTDDIEKLKAFYGLIMGKLRQMQSQQIIREESLGPQYERTAFQDSTTVDLDFTAARLTVND